MLIDYDRRSLKKIEMKNKKITVIKVTAELNVRETHLASIKTITSGNRISIEFQNELKFQNYTSVMQLPLSGKPKLYQVPKQKYLIYEAMEDNHLDNDFFILFSTCRISSKELGDQFFRSCPSIGPVFVRR